MYRRRSLRQELSSAMLRALIHQTRTGAQSPGPSFSPLTERKQRHREVAAVGRRFISGSSDSRAGVGRGHAVYKPASFLDVYLYFLVVVNNAQLTASHHPPLLSALLITSLGWISRKRITGSKDWTVFKTPHPHRPAPALLLESLAFFPTLS